MRKRVTYNAKQKMATIVMIVALFWLCISAPFVLESHKQAAAYAKLSGSSSPFDAADEEGGNPFNNTEEKTPKTVNSFSEEYLHDHHATEQFFLAEILLHIHENATIYIAFHGEPFAPPPNIG